MRSDTHTIIKSESDVDTLLWDMLFVLTAILLMLLWALLLRPVISQYTTPTGQLPLGILVLIGFVLFCLAISSLVVPITVFSIASLYWKLRFSDQYTLISSKYAPTENLLWNSCRHILLSESRFKQSRITVLSTTVDSSLKVVCLAGRKYTALEFTFEELQLTEQGVAPDGVSGALRDHICCGCGSSEVCMRGLEIQSVPSHSDLYLCPGCINDCLTSLPDATKEEIQTKALVYNV